MKNPLFLIFSVMMAGVVIGLGQSAPEMSNSYQTLEDIRKPELTISGDGSRPIRVIAYNPNGRFVAVADYKTIRVYDARRGDRLTAELTQTLSGHRDKVMAIGFSGTNTLVSVALDQTAKIWDITSGKMIHSVKLVFGKRGVAAFAPREQPLLAGAAFKEVALWNYQTGEVLTNFVANDSGVAAVAFTPDGKSLVIGTTKGVVRVLDVATLKVTRIIDLDSPIHSLAATTNRVLLGYGDGTVAMLKFEEQPSIPEVKKQNGAINAVAFSPSGEQFAAASADGTVTVWDTETLKLLCSMEGHRGAALAVAFSPEGREMVSSGADGTVNYWMVPLPPSR